MKRGKPLKRHTWMRRKRVTPRKSGRVRDRDYLLAVKELPCCCPDHVFVHGPFLTAVRIDYPHHGPIEADHAGRRPLGRKSNDNEAIPLCQHHHVQRTNYVGYFLGMQGVDMRAWCDERIAEARARLGWKEAA